MNHHSITRTVEVHIAGQTEIVNVSCNVPLKISTRDTAIKTHFLKSFVVKELFTIAE